MTKHILYGASGHAKVILDAMELNGMVSIILVDDNSSIQHLMGFKVLLPTIINNGQNTSCLISVGNNYTRKTIVDKLDTAFYSIVHPWLLLLNP